MLEGEFEEVVYAYFLNETRSFINIFFFKSERKEKYTDKGTILNEKMCVIISFSTSFTV